MPIRPLTVTPPPDPEPATLEARMQAIGAAALQLSDAYALWSCTGQPPEWHAVYARLADVVLACCQAATLMDELSARPGTPGSAA